jgi:WD40 repeat protein
MSEGESDRVEALFHEVADLPFQERQTRLDVACAGAPDLRAAVERLLADDARLLAEDGTTAFLKSPLVRPPPSTCSTSISVPALPSHIGRFRILRLLGEGGMGAVYEAEQDNPRRPVALKVIRPGLVSPTLLKRFGQEAQILGRLHHPGIAQIYEAGVAEDGQPFFALEFIVGVALDEHGRRHGLDVTARLELLAGVCAAVQHAHDHGIIHRDLKPGNILVDETGQPKVLDFGVARATDADLRTSADRTKTGQLVGTLSYMSPEQVAADVAALDQRSDVYTLGVILYELLADRLPYFLERLTLLEAARVIREQEPSRLGSIDPRLRGDIETIAAKALEKDKERRYPSAAALASDIRRHLRHEPIWARPPSALYLVRKFARRNKAVVGGVASVIAALVVGLIGTMLFAAREAEQRAQAEHYAGLATAEKHGALYQAYRARIAAAGAALQMHDLGDAARQLREAPEELRDWEWQHLHSRLDDSSMDFAAPLWRASFLPRGADGLSLAVVDSQRLRLLNEQGFEEQSAPFAYDNNAGFAIQRAADGLLILELEGNAVSLRDRTGKRLLTMTAPAGANLQGATLSPDSRWLALSWKSDREYRIAICDSTSAKEQASWPLLHTDRILSLTSSPDSTHLLSTSEDGTARLWDVATGRPIGPPMRHGSGVKLLRGAFRPDGTRLVTCSADGTVCQWDARTGVEVAPPFEGHAGEVSAAVYSPDGQWIASGGADQTVRLWRATGRREVRVLHGHTGKVTLLTFSRDGRRLGSVSEDGTARIWETDPLCRLPVLSGHESYVYPVAYSPDGQWVASGSWDGNVRLWDALTGEPCANLRLGGFVRTLAFSPDSSWLVTGCDGDGRLQIWDIATARLRSVMRGSGGTLGAVAVSPDGARIAALSFEGALSVSEVATGQEVFHLDQTRNEMTAVAYSPDGRWLAGGGADLSTVYLWDAQTYQLAARFTGHTGAVHAIAFSPDNRCLVSGGEDRVVRVWDVGTGECQIELHGHTGAVFGAAFHRTGTRLATAGRDRAIWLWDLRKGEEVARLPGHADYVWSLAFSPDGKSLVSGSGDGTVRLWDTATLKMRYQSCREAAALRPEAEKLVKQWWRQKNDVAEIVNALHTDRSLAEPLRQATLRAMLRRTLLPDATPHDPP